MKKYILTFLCICISCINGMYISYAARMYIESPATASSNREPVVVTIFLDPEHVSISGLSADLSFPSELFDVKTITTQNGVVPLWIVEPQISQEKHFDQKTHIVFEGIVPGGFNGVRTVYDTKLHAGILFTVVLIPKNKGEGDFLLQNIDLREFTSNATYIPSVPDKKKITVPFLTGEEVIPETYLKNVTPSSVNFEISKSDLVNNGAPYVYVYDENPSHTIKYIEIAETNEYDPYHVSEYAWRKATNPYVLAYTKQTKYVHAKIVYTDNTYVFKTIAPVENSQKIMATSRILVYIIVSISLIYFYGKKLFESRKKNNKK